MKAIANRYKQVGLSPMPVQHNKAPAGLPHPPYEMVWSEEEQAEVRTTWKHLQSEFITDEAIEKIRWEKIGVVTGKISGNLEVIDVDCKYDDTGTLWDDLAQEIVEYFPDMMDQFYITHTTNGGFHIYYKCEEIGGNQKLAEKEDRHVLIETRGEGGFVVGIPSEGYQVVQGSAAAIPTLTIQQRQVLINICKGFNQYEAPIVEYKTPEVSATLNSEDSPFKAYNETGDPVGLLQKHGWTIVKETSKRIYVKRPGDSDALHSGDWHKEKKLFKVFSTSTIFEDSRAYDAAGVFQMLEANNNAKEACKELVAAGYGSFRENNLPTKTEKSVAVMGEKTLSFDFEEYSFENKQGNKRYDIPHEVAIHLMGTNYVFMRGFGYFFPTNQGVIDFTKPLHYSDFVAAVRDAGYANERDIKLAVDSSKLKKISAIDIFHHQLVNTPWDGTDRINDLVTAMNLEEDHDNNVYLIYKFLKNTLAFCFRGCESKIREEKMYQRVAMILLSQEKGWGKTSFFRKIGLDGQLSKFFRGLGHDIDAELYTEYQGMLTEDATKAEVVATNGMITNIDDIDNMLINQKSEGKLRATVSQNKITTRPLYSNNITNLRRTAVYVGTTNNPRLLRDRTENRWMVFRMAGQMDFEFLENLDIIQLWAQIYKEVIKGDYDDINFTQQDLKRIQNTTEDYLYRTPFEVWVEENWEYDTNGDCTYEGIKEAIPHVYSIGLRDNEIVRAFGLLLGDGQETNRRVRVDGKYQKKWNFSRKLESSVEKSKDNPNQTDLPW